jgi:hypothetical protein
MEWIIFFLILGFAIVAFPYLLRAAKSSAKGAVGGMVMGLGMAFTILLDPAKKSAMENLDKKKNIGNPNADAAGDPKE